MFREQTKFYRYRGLGNLQLLSATYINQSFPRHTHDEFVIGLIESGAEEFNYRGSKQVVSQGNLFIVNPGEVHTGKAVDQEGWAYKTLYVDSQLLQQVSNEANGHNQISFFPELILRDSGLTKSFQQLYLTIERMDSLLECESKLLNFFASLTSSHSDTRRTIKAIAKESPLMKQVSEYLEAHYDENISLEDLAKLVNLSKFHLLHTFSAEKGRPPHAYLEQIRINRAKALLLKGKAITEVALETGYIDQSHFTNRFKRFVGITPRQFAKGQQ